jgi:hypothetical protein
VGVRAESLLLVWVAKLARILIGHGIFRLTGLAADMNIQCISPDSGVYLALGTMEPAMSQVEVMDELSVHVVTGETLYAGENGFASMWGEAKTNDPAVRVRLQNAIAGEHAVTLRCAMIDVIGKIRQKEAGDESRFIVSVNDLTYRNPGSAANGA